MSARVISLGSVNVDVQVRAPRWPEPGEALLVRDYARLGGGKGANVAWLARRFGVESTLLARVGDDEGAELALGPLREAGVDLAGVRRVEGCATAVSLIVTRDDGDKAILLAMNANDAWTNEDAQDAAEIVMRAEDGSVLVADVEVPPFVTERAIEAAQRRGFRVVLDPSPADRVTHRMLAGASFVTPNASEARALLGAELDPPEGRVQARPHDGPQDARRGDEDPIETGRALRERGAGAALVKLAGGGCVIVADGIEQRVDAPEVEVVDTTGAGDAFAAALAVAILEGRDLVEATRFAVVTSALAVTGYTSRPSYPTRAEVERVVTRAAAARRRP